MGGGKQRPVWGLGQTGVINLIKLDSAFTLKNLKKSDY